MFFKLDYTEILNNIWKKLPLYSSTENLKTCYKSIFSSAEDGLVPNFKFSEGREEIRMMQKDF